MAASQRDGIDHLGTQFRGQFRQVLIFDLAQIRRVVYAIKKRCCRPGCHFCCLGFDSQAALTPELFLSV
jgi:hypothetical protein